MKKRKAKHYDSWLQIKLPREMRDEFIQLTRRRASALVRSWIEGYIAAQELMAGQGGKARPAGKELGEPEE